MNLSIVIPFYNEEESLKELFLWIKKVVDKMEIPYEVIFVNDGSTDNSLQEVRNLEKEHSEIKIISFGRNKGKSEGLNVAFEAAEGQVVITMDADLQDSPDEIPELYRMITEDNYDLVSGWKQNRKDSVVWKNMPSKLFNAVARKASGLSLHDFNCGLKAYKKEVIKTVDVYGDKHRYIPLLAKKEGFSRITEKKVTHYARKYGNSKFGIERFFNGFLDLISLYFINKFGKSPMHFFGTIGIFLFFAGFLSAFFIGVVKLYRLYYQLPYKLVTDNPWFYISLVCMILGTQLFLAGFIGELIVKSFRNFRKQNK